MLKKMMFYIKTTLLITMVFFVCMGSPEAQNSNADSDGGNISNSGSGCASKGVACSIQNAHRIKVRLVYYDRDKGKEEIIAGPTQVEPEQWGWYTVGAAYEFNSDNFERTVVGNNNDEKPKKREKLQNFINSIGWNVNLDSLTKESCEVNRTGNCYKKSGYRLIAELYIGLASYAGEGVGSDYHSVKGLNPNTTYLDYVYNGVNRGSQISNKMSIVWADIHYHCNNNGKGLCNSSSESVSCLVDNNCGYGIWIVDITSAIQAPRDYSLDMACENCDSKVSDSKAMVIQDTNNWEAIKNSKQVSSSATSTCTNRVKNHFYKQNDKVYCREEYHVHFPNANNKISVHLGRYFTLNANKDILNTLEDGLIPNLAPIKVTKIRTCKGGDGDLEQFRKSSDDNFAKCGGEIIVSYNEVVSNGYELKNEKLKGTLDSYSSSVSQGTLQQTATFNYTLKDNIFRYIRIKDGYSVIGKPTDSESYRDIKVSNLPVSMGKAIKNNTKIAVLKFKYSLPNGSTSCTDLDSDMYYAYKNGGSNNNYLNCANNNNNLENIYKKYPKVDDEESINDSACVKLYGTSGLGKAGSKVMKCINERKTNKMGNCYNANENDNYSCVIAANVCDKSNAGSSLYPDMVWDDNTNRCVQKCSHVDGEYFDKNGNKVDKNAYENSCCNSSNYEDMGRDLNKNNNTCCPSGSVWADGSNKCCSSGDYDPVSKTCGGKPGKCNKSTAGTGNFANKVWSDVDNKCCDKDQYESGRCCNVDNCSSLNRDWNDNEGICCPSGQRYNAVNRKCEALPTNKCNSLSCGDKPCCVDCHGKGYCGNGSVSKGTGYCPGKPCTVKTCKDDNCNLLQDIAVYRVIDPASPFVAQSGGGTRETGDNWCSNPASGSHVCSGTNENNVVKKVVTDKANVTEEKAMYTVKLDSNTINSIRAYNNRNSYDDFKLECTSDGQKCRSSFLNSTIRSAVDTSRSSCFGVGNSSFDTCG